MGIVVQKYGGSSVADAAGIKRVARRIVDAQEAGHDVVVVVSAMGDTTDELLDLAEQVSAAAAGRASSTCCSPPASGSRWRWSRWRSPTSAHQARSFTGSQAGVITDSAHGKAKIIDVTPGPHRRPRSRAARSRSSPGSRASRQDTKDITTLGRGGTDTTAVALAAALDADVCEIYTDVDGVFTADPRIVPTARKLDRVSYEEMLEMAACGAKILHLRCVEYARRYDIPIHVRSSFSQQGGHLDRRPTPPGRRQTMEQAIIAGVAHDRSEAKITVVGVPDKVGEAARIFEALADAQINIDMIVQNVSAAATSLTDISFTLPRADGQTAMAALAAAPGRGRLRLAALRRPDRQGLADRRRHALAPRHHREVLRRARRGRRQHRDDLHLRDPHLGDRRRGAGRRGRRRPPTPRSTSTPTRSRPSSTAGPADEPRRRIGIVGATGQVGVAMRQILARARLPGRRGPLLRLGALGRHGAAVRRPRDHRRGRRHRRPERPRHRAVLRRRDDVAGAGAAVRRRPASIVVDNSSAFRMDPDVPLVVSEVNPRGRSADGAARASSPTRTAPRWPRCRCSSRCTTRPGWSG